MPRSDATPHRDAPIVQGRRVSDAGAQALTEIERKILDFMVQYLRANTYQPSIREIGERFGIKSTKTVSEHLQALADKGFLERDPSRSRGVKILGVDLSSQSVALPCFPRMPESRHARSDEQIAIDRRLAGTAEGFFVRAGTPDLAVIGVEEGDYLLVEPTALDDVEDGAIIAARVGSGSWFHRFTRNGTGVYLEALRPGGGTTHVQDPERLDLRGRVIAFYRRLDESAGGLNLTQH